LEGNHLTSLPEDFFHLFPNLKWLDLRHNKLVIIPSIYLRNHQNLQTVLLEGNQLRTLPLELGIVDKKCVICSRSWGGHNLSLGAWTRMQS